MRYKAIYTGLLIYSTLKGPTEGGGGGQTFSEFCLRGLYTAPYIEIYSCKIEMKWTQNIEYELFVSPLPAYWQLSKPPTWFFKTILGLNIDHTAQYIWLDLCWISDV